MAKIDLHSLLVKLLYSLFFVLVMFDGCRKSNICDSGRKGNSCECLSNPSDFLPGMFHVTGTYYSGSSSGSGTSTIDDTITITKVDETTISGWNRNLELQSGSCESNGNYVYSKSICNCMPVTLTFIGSSFDSITYRDYQTSPGHTTDLYLKGVRVN